MAPSDRLTDLQRHVISAFFSLPESQGYVLAGGAGLLAAGLSRRPTDDVDLFGSDLASGVTEAADAFEALCHQRAWTVTRLRDAPSFRRLEVDDGEDALLVDLAIDTPALGTLNVTDVGPTFAPSELAARKLVALFDRAAARDFADLATLAHQFDVDELLTLAANIDTGFDLQVFVTMLRSVDRFSDDDLAATGSDPAVVRHFATGLADRLS